MLFVLLTLSFIVTGVWMTHMSEFEVQNCAAVSRFCLPLPLSLAALPTACRSSLLVLRVLIMELVQWYSFSPIPMPHFVWLCLLQQSHKSGEQELCGHIYRQKLLCAQKSFGVASLFFLIISL